MTRNTVAKFGGTSVKTASAIRQIGHILTSNPTIKVVVVSAVAGVTNLLVELCKTPKGIRASLIQQIQNIHLDLVQQLNLPIQDQITQTILRLNNIQDFSSPQVMDYALSQG